MTCVCWLSFLVPLIHRWYSESPEFWCVHSACKFSHTQSKREMYCVFDWMSSNADSLYRPPFCLNQIVSNNGRKQWCSMKHAQLTNSTMSFLSRALCSISNHLRKCDTKWEGWERIAEGREYWVHFVFVIVFFRKTSFYCVVDNTLFLSSFFSSSSLHHFFPSLPSYFLSLLSFLIHFKNRLLRK